MLGIEINIVRYISDAPQPGIVECHVEDAYGRRWSVVEKTMIVSAELLDIHSDYPQQGGNRQLTTLKDYFFDSREATFSALSGGAN